MHPRESEPAQWYEEDKMRQIWATPKKPGKSSVFNRHFQRTYFEHRGAFDGLTRCRCRHYTCMSCSRARGTGGDRQSAESDKTGVLYSEFKVRGYVKADCRCPDSIGQTTVDRLHVGTQPTSRDEPITTYFSHPLRTAWRPQGRS